MTDADDQKERFSRIRLYFTDKEWEAEPEYERNRYLNIYENYEYFSSLGMKISKPFFVVRWEKRKKSQNSRKRRREAKATAAAAVAAESDEEWVPDEEDGQPPKMKKKSNGKKRVLSGKKIERRYPQRSTRKVNYRDPEVPEDDHYIFCEDCQCYFEGECPEHPLLFVKDTPVPPRYRGVKALKTLPPRLMVKTSPIPMAGSGVFAETDVRSGTVYGPYKGKSTTPEKCHESGYTWEVARKGQENLYLDGQDQNTGNWMRYVNCARTETEQNLVAFQYRQAIYYRTFKPIATGTEFLVYYGDGYASELGILEGVGTNLSDNEDQDSSSEDTADEEESTSSSSSLSVRVRVVAPRAQSIASNNSRYQHVLDPSKKYRCQFCNYCTNHGGIFKNHTAIHSDNKQFKCTKCSTFASHWKKDLTRHMKTCSGIAIQCGQCCEKFFSRQDLAKHDHQVHNKAGFPCDHCGKVFSSMSTLNRHAITHTGKRFECEFCGRSFSYKYCMQKHQQKCPDKNK